MKGLFTCFEAVNPPWGSSACLRVRCDGGTVGFTDLDQHLAAGGVGVAVGCLSVLVYR